MLKFLQYYEEYGVFGYINIKKDKLTDNQYSCYKAVYCSLCKTMGKEYSIFSRFILSYDCTFYAVLIMSYQDIEPGFEQGRCPFNPLNKTSYCKSDEKALSLAAAVSVSTAYYKLIDNINDSSFFKRIIYKLLLHIFRRWNNKAKIRYPEIDSIVSEMIDSQLKAEEDRQCMIDKACDPSAVMLSKLCGIIPSAIDSEILKSNASSQRILSTFGYFLGRWIYLMDAADDYEKDLKTGNFNPFVIRYGESFDRKSVVSTLNHCLSEMMLSYELLDKGRYDVLISNVLFLGLPAKQNEILKIESDNKQE